MLHILGDEENWVLKARIHSDTFTAAAGERSHSFPNITEHPPEHSDNVWFNPETGAMAHPADTPNPYEYKREQQKVFTWAMKNIHDPAYLAYGLRGSTERASIFHVFAVINVMAALKKENITGDNWGKVKSNLVGWKEFVSNIRISDWTNSLRLNYATFIATPVALFPNLQPNFRMRNEGGGAIVIDPTLISQVGDYIPVRS